MNKSRPILTCFTFLLFALVLVSTNVKPATLACSMAGIEEIQSAHRMVLEVREAVRAWRRGAAPVQPR